MGDTVYIQDESLHLTVQHVDSYSNSKVDGGAVALFAVRRPSERLSNVAARTSVTFQLSNVLEY